MRVIGRSPGWMAIIASVLLAAACGGGSRTGTTSTSGTPVSGGTFTFLHTKDAVRLDPVAATGASSPGGDAQEFSAIYGMLAYVDPTNGTVVPQMAQSLTSTDSLTWMLKLRPNVQFTDRTPYDAAAVKATWDRMADPVNKSPSQAVTKAIQSTQVVDATTLKITLASVNSQFPRVVATFLSYIASPTAVAAAGATYGTSPSTTVGAGPFVVKDWIQNSQLTMTRNPNYWDKPRPYIDTLVIKLISDDTQRLNTLTTSAQAAQFLFTPGDVTKAVSSGYKAYQLPPYPSAGYYWQYNMTRPPLNDARVRKALQEAIDWSAYDAALFNGLPFKQDLHVVRPPSPLADASAQLPAYNKAGAQALFDAYAKDTGGPVNLEFNPSQTILNVGEFYQTQLLQYQNVKVTIKPIQAAQALSIYGSKNYMISGLPINAYDPDSNLYDELHTGGSRNFTGYSDPKMDAALDAGRKDIDPKLRAADYKTVQELVTVALPGLWLPIYVTSGSTALAANVHDYQETPGNPLFDRVWLSK